MDFQKSDGSDGGVGGVGGDGGVGGVGGVDDDYEFFESIRKLYDSSSTSSTDTNSTDKSFPRRAWSQVDDFNILRAIETHGSRWRFISRELNIGSDDALRNRVMRMDIYKVPWRFKSLVKNVQTNSKRKNEPLRWMKNSCESTNKKTTYPWSPEEDAYIRTELLIRAPRNVWKLLNQTTLAHRTKHAIRNRAARLGLVKGGVSDSSDLSDLSDLSGV